MAIFGDPEKGEDKFKAEDDGSPIDTIAALVQEDHQHDIKLRTMSWQKAAWLLAGDQVCLAIMAQTWSLSVLGWVPGLITMLVAGVFFWFTSMTMHKFIMRHSHIRDICDFASYCVGGSRIAYEAAGVMLTINNVMIIGFHIFTGAKIINTLSDHAHCTVIYSVIVMILGIIMSLPRTLRHVSLMSMFSAACMALSILLFVVYVGIEDAPSNGPGKKVYPQLGPVKSYNYPPKGTSFVGIMNAVLNITFLWVPQILFPTFIAEMERPQDFPKALAVLTAISAVLFTVPPAIGFYFLGQYSTAPAFGSLGLPKFKKSSFAFVIVPTLVIGVIYANVSAKFIYNRIMGSSRHAHSHTVTGWSAWIAVMATIWAVAFIFAEVIPSMGDFLSLLGAAFDSFFGFIFFALAYFNMHRGNYFAGAKRSLATIGHVLVMLAGLFLLGPGLYAAVDAIIDDYSGSTTPAFTCADSSL